MQGLFYANIIGTSRRYGKCSRARRTSPFADIELINYVYNIPWHMKYLNNEEKGILRAAFSDELPPLISKRKKSPYPKTYHPKYTKLIADKLTDDLKTDNILTYLFDEEKLRQLIESGGANFDQPWFGQLMKGPQLLAYLYQLQTWFTTYDVLIEF